MLAAAFLFLAAAQADVPEAADAFRSRQDDLVLLARKLGSLHRLNQVCPSYDSMTLFRDRMQEVVEGEKPIRATREAMIEAFNLSYNETARLYAACSSDAGAAMRREALEALAVTERLSGEMSREPVLQP
ncbi:MAG: TIGR02301 family protein [Pseudomonadota bacterium]